jgi:hypothetical protein
MEEFDIHDFQCRNIYPKYVNKYNNGMNEISHREKWNPPQQSGLSNSQSIIPIYYLTNKCDKKKIFCIDYYSTIEDSIKNLRSLTPSQTQFLKEHPEKQLDIIKLYGEVMENVVDNL